MKKLKITILLLTFLSCLSVARADNDELIAMLQDLQGQVESLTGQNNYLQSVVDDQNAQISALNTSLSTAEGALDVANSNLATATTANSNLQSSLDTANQQLSSANASLATANAANSELQSSLDAANLQLAAARTNAIAEVVASPGTFGLFSQSDVDASRTAGRADVTANPGTYNLYTPDGLRNLYVGTPLLLRDQDTGKFRIQLALQTSTNLVSFAPMPFLSDATSVNSQGEIEFTFNVSESIAFFRISAR